MPKKLAEAIEKGGIRNISLYDYNLNFICDYDKNKHGTITDLLVQKRNEGMHQEQQRELIFVCYELRKQLEMNRQAFPQNMYKIMQEEIKNIDRELEIMLRKGEKER